MAEVNANTLPAKTDLGSNDSAIVVDQTTNAGALVDLDVLADKVLDRITSKTFANQVGGSSAATLLAQLSTLNYNLAFHKKTASTSEITIPIEANSEYILIVGKVSYSQFSSGMGIYTAGRYQSAINAYSVAIVNSSSVDNLSFSNDKSTLTVTFKSTDWYGVSWCKINTFFNT